MKSLGKHLIIELFQCNNPILNDPKALEQHLLEAVKLTGATIIKHFMHQYSPFGVTGFALIAESHFSIHTWPEYNYCAIDIFTCGEDIKGEKGLDYLKKSLKAKNVSVMEIKRGVLDLPQSQIKHKPNI